MCKDSNVFSRPVLIGRGLDTNIIPSLCRFEGTPDRRCFEVSGGFGERETPLPIPNREVKPLSADGTARETVWESRTPPGFFLKGPPFNGGPFFVVRALVSHHQFSWVFAGRVARLWPK